LIYATIIAAIAIFFDFTNGFHDAANVVATIIVTGALSPVQALALAAVAEFTGPFLFGTAVAETIGKNIIDVSSFSAAHYDLSVSLLIAAVMGAIIWNLVTWYFGLPSSSSHALVGGMIGAVLIAHGADKILLLGVMFVLASLILSPFLGLVVGAVVLKATLYFSRTASPDIKKTFSRLQILSSLALALSHGTNDAQKSMGVITLSLVLLGIIPSFQVPFWVVASCALAIALGTASGGWRIIRTMGTKIYRVRVAHAFCAQTSSAMVILSAALLGGPVSTTHVVASSIMGVGAGDRIAGVRWGVAKNIIVSWFITIPASGAVAAVTFLLIKILHPAF
jgi:PiT family inorganic phosphate transporter